MHGPPATGNSFYLIEWTEAIPEGWAKRVAPARTSMMCFEASIAEITDVGRKCVAWHTYLILAVLALTAVRVLLEMVSV